MFRDKLSEFATASGERTWIYVPYDQLSDQLGPLATMPPTRAGIVLVESRWKAARRPYHKQKLAFVLANMRQFALEQAARGVAVRYLHVDGSYAEALRGVVADVGPLVMMEAAERELRADLASLVQSGDMEVVPHGGWMSSLDDFTSSQKAMPPWRMDRFYRHMRQKTGVLMDAQGKPLGGKYSHDAANRKAWSGAPRAPAIPTFAYDAVTREVLTLVEREFPTHPGSLSSFAHPTTLVEAEQLWDWAKTECMNDFGPFEDAMSADESTLFHTRLSPVLNVQRLLARTVVEEVLPLDIPLSSKEGFVRQVLGWREFMHHVHAVTDGFRRLPNMDPPTTAEVPGDGGYAAWAGTSFGAAETAGVDGGAQPNVLGTRTLLPSAFWGAPSGLRCLDTVVKDVWNEAYSHHITRLMILCNLAQLLDVDPRSVADWFWVAYADAYDWVVEPNVLGMGMFALADLFVTKPYVSGTPYIDKMSDYCGACSFHPKKTCPISSLYWAYLERHREQFQGNHRMAMPLRSLAKRGDDKKHADKEAFERVVEVLGRGERLTP